MTFTGNEGAVITLAEGSKMTAAYRATISTGDTIALAVGKNLVNSILGQTGCMGIRMYFALDEDENKQLVLVGVDANGDDMTAGVIVDNMITCPNICSKKNSLNS
jgi:hypothetical protein